MEKYIYVSIIMLFIVWFPLKLAQQTSYSIDINYNVRLITVNAFIKLTKLVKNIETQTLNN